MGDYQLTSGVSDMIMAVRRAMAEKKQHTLLQSGGYHFNYRSWA